MLKKYNKKKINISANLSRTKKDKLLKKTKSISLSNSTRVQTEKLLGRNPTAVSFIFFIILVLIPKTSL